MKRVEVHGDDVAPLVSWLSDGDGGYRSEHGRLRRRPSHAGPLSVQTTHSHERTRVVVRIRNTKRRRNQYAAIARLDDLELRVGDRYFPARDVIA